MNAISFINERTIIGKEEQLLAANEFLKVKSSEIKVLNPFQLNPHYTNFLALLFDLKLKREEIDLLIIHSVECAADFANTYPARWLLIKSFFHQVVFIQNKMDSPRHFMFDLLSERI